MIESDLTPHLDRRIVRTRKAIRSAYLDLLMEMDYEKITITALAKKANIDRKTFYTHYTSIDALTEDVIRQYYLEGHIDLTLKDLIENPINYSKQTLYTLIEKFPLDKKQRAIIFNHIPHETFMRYLTLVAREQMNDLFEDMPPETKQYIDFILEFYLGAVLHAYIYWLTEQTNITFDEAVAIISTSIADGLHGILDLNILPTSFIDKQDTTK